LAEQAEKMAEIERERAKAQELMEEARKLRDGYLERKKNGDQEVLSYCLKHPFLVPLFILWNGVTIGTGRR
jgi:hypothetical protein